MKNKPRPRTERAHLLVAIWLPADLLRALDRAVAARDTDRSKLIRAILRREFDKTSQIDLTLSKARTKYLVRD